MKTTTQSPLAARLTLHLAAALTEAQKKFRASPTAFHWDRALVAMAAWQQWQYATGSSRFGRERLDSIAAAALHDPDGNLMAVTIKEITGLTPYELLKAHAVA